MVARLRRDGIDVGRGRVERLMRRLGLAGAVRGKTVRTTVQDKDGVRAADLVNAWTFVATHREQIDAQIRENEEA